MRPARSARPVQRDPVHVQPRQARRPSGQSTPPCKDREPPQRVVSAQHTTLRCRVPAGSSSGAQAELDRVWVWCRHPVGLRRLASPRSQEAMRPTSTSSACFRGKGGVNLPHDNLLGQPRDHLSITFPEGYSLGFAASRRQALIADAPVHWGSAVAAWRAKRGTKHVRKRGRDEIKCGRAVSVPPPRPASRTGSGGPSEKAMQYNR